jgi:hypothetical protein
MSRKKIKTKTMKKNLLGLIACLSILISTSCTQTLPGGSNTGGGVSPLTSWSCEIDGVPYSWSGTFSFPNVPGINDGKSWYTASLAPWSGPDSVGIIILELPGNYGRPKQKFGFVIPTVAVGTYNFTDANFWDGCSLDWDTAYYQIPPNPGSFSSGYIGSPASFTVKIDTLSPSSSSFVSIVYANANSGLGLGSVANAGLVSGTFSGTLYQENNKHVTITNGKFRSLRYQ